MPDSHPNAIVATQRILPFTPKQIFEAFQQPDQLARWWGPKGFTNTFEQFEFKAVGRWVYVMRAANGASYSNQSLFQKVSPGQIIILHTSPPLFTLTVTLTGHERGTHIAWNQEFETADLASKLCQLSEAANEENLDRLQTVLQEQTQPNWPNNASPLRVETNPSPPDSLLQSVANKAVTLSNSMGLGRQSRQPASSAFENCSESPQCAETATIGIIFVWSCPLI